jgi:hypothetical protein
MVACLLPAANFAIDARTDEPRQTDLIEDEAATAEILVKIVELINDPRKGT